MRVAPVPAGIASLAIFGFLASDFDGLADTVLIVLGVAIFILITALAGYYTVRAWAAPVGALVAILALVAAFYGNYAAYAFHWQGLQPRDLGSPDRNGHTYVIFNLVVALLPVAALGALSGISGYLAGSRLPPRFRTR